MTFRFYGSRQPQLSRAWLHALTQTANAPTGLYVVSEPDERDVPADPRESMRFDVVAA